MKKAFRLAGASALVLAISASAGCSMLPLTKPYRGPAVVAVNTCEDLTATIYFDRDSAALTRDARAVLRGAAAQAEGCGFDLVEVYGLSDPVGSPAANLKLSGQRADAVRNELARLGYNQLTFKLIAGGAVGAVMPSGAIDPLRRRADVIFTNQR
ncbi:MAG TPA: OmpA family protein [Caulobacteraceae bacterium]